MMRVGEVYRLRFPGTFARIVEHDPKNAPFSWRVVSLVMRDRWWVDERGRPNNHCSPLMVVVQ